MKSCDDVRDLLPDVGALLPAALEVHEHLGRCDACAEEAEEQAQVRAALLAAPGGAPELGPEFAERVLAALPPEPEARAVRRAGWALRAAAAAAVFVAGGGLGALAAAGHRAPAPAPVEARAPLGAAPAPLPAAGRAGEAPGAPDSAPQRTPPSFEAYLAEAGVVLQAVERLDPRDPRRLHGLSQRVHQAALVEAGDRLLTALEARGDERPLTTLVEGTQLILRKVRRASPERPEAAAALRREVAETGILDAYRQLFSGEPAATAPAPVLDPL